MVAEKSNRDLGRDAAGTRVVDKLIEETLTDPAFLTLLLPLPGGRASSSKDGEAVEVEPTGQGKRKLMKENQKLKDQIRDLKSEPDKKKRNTHIRRWLCIEAGKYIFSASWHVSPVKQSTLLGLIQLS